MVQPLWRTVWWFFEKLKIRLPYDLEIPLLHMYQEKTIITKDACIPVFTAAPFTGARTWSLPRCPSTEEWKKEMWHIYNMGYHSET